MGYEKIAIFDKYLAISGWKLKSREDVWVSGKLQRLMQRREVRSTAWGLSLRRRARVTHTLSHTGRPVSSGRLRMVSPVHSVVTQSSTRRQRQARAVTTSLIPASPPLDCRLHWPVAFLDARRQYRS